MYQYGFKYCAKCMAWFTPDQQTNGNKCPTSNCHLTLRTRPKQKKHKMKWWIKREEERLRQAEEQKELLLRRRWLLLLQ